MPEHTAPDPVLLKLALENESRRLAIRERVLKLAERRQDTREEVCRTRIQLLQQDHERAREADKAQVNLKHNLLAVWTVFTAVCLGAATLNPLFAAPLAPFYLAFQRFARLLLVGANTRSPVAVPTITPGQVG